MNNTLENRLKELRKENGYTQEDIAKKLGLTKSAYGYYEQAKTVPDAHTLSKLANIFNVSVDYLLGRTDERNNNSKSNKIDINKNEKDVEELLEETMSQILNQDGLMLNGQIVDDNDLILLRNALKNGIEYVKSMKSKK